MANIEKETVTIDKQKVSDVNVKGPRDYVETSEGETVIWQLAKDGEPYKRIVIGDENIPTIGTLIDDSIPS